MPLFSQTIMDFWHESFLNGDVLYRDGMFTVAINPELDEDSRVMVLEMADGQTMAVLTPELAGKVGLNRRQELSESIFRRKLQEAGITMHGADYVFYFSEAEKSSLLREHPEGDLRRLTERDEAVFADFESKASEQDLDDAQVELDHWAVFGSFEENNLVCAASMYPWDDNSPIADLGVLTLKSFRGKGHARRVVRAISKYACGWGYEPQYRCQLDNRASALLAKAAGLTLFGKWDVISPDFAD